MVNPPLILASRSKPRADLLSRLGMPFAVVPAHIDETALKGEAPRAYVKRIACAKALKVAEQNPGHVVLAADTPVIAARRILQTPQTLDEAKAMLRLQSGRRVHIPTVVAVVDARGKLKSLLADSWIKFKPLTDREIESYLAATRWNHVSGALAHENIEPWVVKMQGSPSGIIGLPLYETAKLLAAAGLNLKPHAAA